MIASSQHRIAWSIACMGIVVTALQAKDPADSLKGRSSQLGKSTGLPTYAVLNINNLTSWMRYDGHSNHSPGGDDGLYYPRGTGSAIYQDGFVWGGKVFLDAAMTRPGPTHAIRIGGGTYGIGTSGGAIIGSGATAIRENPNASDVRVFRIRRDYFTMSESEAIRDAASVNEIQINSVTDAQVDAVKEQYAKDWYEWPVAKGAPFIDRNGNGVYDPPPAFSIDFTPDSLSLGGYDEPGVSGPDATSPAGQVIFTVYNDLNVTQAQSFMGSLPIGLEVQKTMWGYGNIKGLSEIYFTRYRIINKGGVDTSAATTTDLASFWIDSIYIAQWCDPDIGDAGDDLVGCDTLLKMGFAYNARDEDAEYQGFSLKPPAVGFDLLAGPAVPAPDDSSIFNFRRRSGSRNLSMTSFGYSRAPGSIDPDPPGGASSYNTLSGQWWKMLRGFMQFGSFSTADRAYETPPGVSASMFPLSGEPIAESGWLDGEGQPYSPVPNDRRMHMNSGPFRMAPGDTQEIYLAMVAGIGADRLSSISVMKSNDNYAQLIFNSLFSLPAPPTPPSVKVIALNEEIILDWGSSLQGVRSTEETVSSGIMLFEGYNVYELPSPTSSIDDGVRLATYDIVNNRLRIYEGGYDPVDFFGGELEPVPPVIYWGSNSGIQRWYKVTDSRLTDGERTPLVNGKEYHFAVTAYSVNVNYIGGWPTALSSKPVVFSVKPGRPFGIEPVVQFGDTIDIQHTAGASTARVIPIVIDPLGGTGNRYRVNFGGPPDSLQWSIANLSTGTAVTSGHKNFSGDEDYPMVGGLIVKVIADSSSALSSTDSFEFTSMSSSRTTTAENASVARIGVYPNPYYGDREQISSRLEQSVTFTNLPQKAVIRIFNLAGHLVRTIHKDDASQFTNWDIKNDHNRLVGSGMYICYIELPDLDRTKILKVAIITGERIAQPQ